MQSSQIPAKSERVFAQSATGSYVRAIPQTTVDAAAASYELGFPPATFTDEGAGGTPPDGRDFNGILNQLDAWRRWLTAGAPVKYDAAFQTAIGGYPLGTVIMSATTNGLFWLSTTENNVTNPDSGGAGWSPFLGRRATPAEIEAGTEDLKVVTPKGLKDAGIVSVVDSNLNENNGFRVYSDGFKECWGFVTVPANSSVAVALPFTHTSWFNVALGGYVQSSGISQDNCGISGTTGVTSFTIRNTISSSLRFDWSTKGV